MTEVPKSATDRTVLATEAYSDDRHLAARQALYHWQTPRHDLPAIVVDALKDVQGLVVDVGCGNGKFLKKLAEERPDLQLLGLDIAPGILAQIPTATAIADAHRLPLADNSASAVLLAHMLYHVEDIHQALAEARRVLKPSGLVIASTNSATDKAELDDLWSLAAGDVLGVERGPRRVSLSSRFTLEDAPKFLGAHFTDIKTIELPGVIRVEDPAPVVAHMASYRAWAAEYGVPFDATIARARARLTAGIVEQGFYDIGCLGGILIGRNP